LAPLESAAELGAFALVVSFRRLAVVKPVYASGSETPSLSRILGTTKSMNATSAASTEFTTSRDGGASV